MPELPPQKFGRRRLSPRRQAKRPQLSYSELQVTSNFSFLRGASYPEELIETAAALGYRAIALTDWHSLAGIVRAHIAAKAQRIKLIIGARVQPSDAPLALFLYPTDRAAYGRLCQLLTRGKLHAEKGECSLTLQDIRDYQQGLLASVSIPNPQETESNLVLATLKEIFTDDRLSLSLSSTYDTNDPRRQRELAALARTSAIPLVATNDVYYHAAERRELQDVLSCIRERCTIEQAGFRLFANRERHLKPVDELNRLFRRFPQALERTQQITERVTFSLDELRYEYPHEICPAGETPSSYLRRLTFEGARERYPEGLPPKVREQIEYELELIHQLNYEQYFLTVYDIVLFARKRQILHQGRGAAANSAVCYCLGITAVDPDRIALLFERFISKERNEPPDIDIDFEHERREEVIQYLYEKYGRRRAALVCEVITYRRKSALRDVAKVFGLSLDAIENLVKIVSRFDYDEAHPNGLPTLSELAAVGINTSATSIGHIFALCDTLLGFPRHLSQHVGGFILSEQELSEFVPIENAAMPERTVIEWDKDDIDALGMLKIDILALGMLTALRKAFAIINQTPAAGIAPLPSHGQYLMLHNIPAEDQAVYDMICHADTLGVFQIESRAQMSMLPRLRPRCYYDLVIEVAIIRPGPIQGGMVHPYLRRRSGQETVTFPDERMRTILGATLGVPIFQEQAMEIAVVGAGFTRGEADQLRRAMASWKRHKNAIRRFEQRFLEGMINNGYSPTFARQCFDQINGFGEYGFPQSHAASFALLVYVSAWLKHHHPAAFAAALINSQPLGFYQPAQIIEDAKRHDVEVRPIDVQFSSWDCTIEERALRLGLRLVRGLQLKEAERIVAARLRPYCSLKDLWRRSGVSVSTLRHLARADALMSVPFSRQNASNASTSSPFSRQKVSGVRLSRQNALWEIRRLRDKPLPLFERHEEKEPPAQLPPLSAPEQMFADYEFTGLSLRAHPLSFLRPFLTRREAVTASELRDPARCPAGMHTALAGLVLVRQRPSTASGVVFMTLEDETGMANLVVFPKVFQQYRLPLCESAIVYAEGKVQREDGITHLVVETASALQFGEALSLSRDFC